MQQFFVQIFFSIMLIYLSSSDISNQSMCSIHSSIPKVVRRAGLRVYDPRVRVFGQPLRDEDVLKLFEIKRELLPEAFSNTQPKVAELLPKGGCPGLQVRTCRHPRFPRLHSQLIVPAHAGTCRWAGPQADHQCNIV